MIPKGQKRKASPEVESVSEKSGPEWESQRQFVFSVSLIKYQHSQELVEPSLRRFVLIANTLRQFNGATPECPPNSVSALQVKEKESEITAIKPTDGSSDSSDSGTKRSLGNRHARDHMPVEDEDWASMSTEPDFEVETAIASILLALDSTIEGGPQAVQRTPLRSLENLSEGGATWEKQEPQAYFESWQQPEVCRLQDSGLAPGYLGEVTVEDLFQDIDASLLEADIEVLGARGGLCGHPAGDELLRYLPPFAPSSDSFAIALNQNLKCLPAFSSFIPPPSSSSTQNHLREGFELEHLMEVRVES
ncbi:unnamed protein product [Ophioblennius macclurei]